MSMPPVASTGPCTSRSRSCAYVPAPAYAEGRQRRPRASPTRPTSRREGRRPVSTPTPTSPSATPAQRIGDTRSWGRKRSATTNAKIGTVAWAIPATVESMCFSPQAMSQNGSAALNSPNTNVGRPAARSCAVASAAPRVTTRKTSRSRPATSARADIITLGSRSSTATLMKKYELPQRPARRSSQGR